jgi:hypothetical protein
MRKLVAAAVTFASCIASLLACGGNPPPHDRTPPMEGSAAILPSPASAERVPSDSAVPVASVPSITR